MGWVTRVIAVAFLAAVPLLIVRGVGAVSGIDGRIVATREDRVLVAEGGASRTIYSAPRGARVADPAWAPDGSTLAVAYVHPASATAKSFVERLLVADIVLMEADGSGARVAVGHDAPGAMLEGPAWSPDGAALYYSYYRPLVQGDLVVGDVLELRRTDLKTGLTVSLAARGVAPTASPDGALVAYINRPIGADDTLRIVGSDGSGARELVGAGEFYALHAPRFSPDGAQLAFSGVKLTRATTRDWSLTAWLGPAIAYAHGAPWEVFTVPTAGGPIRQLTQLTEDGPSAAWSSDGRRLVVQGEMGLYLVDVAAGTTETLGADGGYGRIDWRSGG